MQTVTLYESFASAPSSCRDCGPVCVPRIATDIFGRRAFAVDTGPGLWNQLPVTTRVISANTSDCFDDAPVSMKGCLAADDSTSAAGTALGGNEAIAKAITLTLRWHTGRQLSW